MKEWNIGDVVSKEDYTACAIFCNKSGDRHIEKIDGVYIVVANQEPPEPTIEEKLIQLEEQTKLTRPVREMVLAEGSGASEYNKQKAQELEDLAEEIRKKKLEEGAAK